MITLFIVVGVYAVECIGSNCYSIPVTDVRLMAGLGVAELIFEIKNVIEIFRKRE